MTPNTIANTPEPPYYAAIFTSLRTEGDQGYGQMAARMVRGTPRPLLLLSPSARAPARAP